ncbi:MAG: glycosyltransferase family 2 protein [Anaerolineae bacterium]
MQQFLFWFPVSIILYTFIGYPIAITLLARFLARPIRKEDITPHVTVLIPAYNEAAIIQRKIENCLALDYPKNQLSVMVVTDGSEDDTAIIVSQFREQGVHLCHQPERKGKVAAINRVVPTVNSEIIVFSDANTMLTPDGIQAIVRSFADDRVGLVAGEKRVMGGGEGLYWRYESHLKRCESALGSVIGAAGELFAIRRELFEKPEDDSIVEDFIMSLRLVASGWRAVYEPAAVAEELPSPSLAGDWERRTRIAAGSFQAMGRLLRLLNPAMGRIAWQYLSHKLLRWAVTPIMLPAAYLLNLSLVNIPIYLALFLGQTIFYGLAAVGFILARRGIRRSLPYFAFYFCLMNIAEIVGFWRYITGKQTVTWVKAR